MDYYKTKFLPNLPTEKFTLQSMVSKKLRTRPLLEIGTENAICWNSLGLFRDYGLDHLFFRDTTFLFFKIEPCTFQHLFEKKMWNLTKFQLNQTTDRKNGNKNCLNELNELKFCEVSRKGLQSWWNGISKDTPIQLAHSALLSHTFVKKEQDWKWHFYFYQVVLLSPTSL